MAWQAPLQVYLNRGALHYHLPWGPTNDDDDDDRALAAAPASAHGCARECSQDDPPCGACLAAGCTLCGLADAHEEEVQVHNDACSRLHYALWGTDDEDSSDDEAVEELELTLEPPEWELRSRCRELVGEPEGWCIRCIVYSAV